ncbi:HAD-IIB family hydrolase [Ruminococcus albus]|nr:HAD family hydrolase [Ruminococcus albus]
MGERWLSQGYKIISFDLDDTLLMPNKRISKEAIEWIKQYQKKGGIVVLASGRDISTIIPYLDQLQMKKGQKGYIISSSGAYLWDLKKDTLDEFVSFSVEDAKAIIDGLLTQSNNCNPMIVCKNMNYIVKSQIYWKDKIKSFFMRCKRRQIRIIPTAMIESIKNHIEKIRVRFDESMDYNHCISNVDKAHYRLIERKHIDYFHDGIDKATALMKVLEKESISPEEVLVFGDDENDITCFENFPYTVAMGNAVSEIQGLAWRKTRSNSENGVYDFLVTNEVSV